jgi:LPXTG-site transpeptidase (sortase) family protein
VIAGHRGIGTPALFSHLEDVQPGDKIHVSDASRGELVYEVTRVASLDLTVASEVQVFGRTSQQQLVLITCFGQYLRTSRTYDHRLVVFSRLLPPNP